ncbi:hypothetical protein V6C03_06245 [Methyloligella sp. 2.7D]|uniref:hypothetical protein n=1 Tax=unclassified Methyloligella TaxID=2625955 RepID=UPI00157D5E03|nr:hypothetical protein [Methyloligella sp. GL2]QKP78493.1 hypothetical protein HT051_14210 [Methyloligella sp. GL2]
MLNLHREQKPSHLIDTDELYAELDALRRSVNSLTHSFGDTASHRAAKARAFASEKAEEAEDLMKDHLAASVLIALGLGALVGFLIGRSTD